MIAKREGENLRRLIARLGLTIEQTAERSGLDHRTVRAVLDGTKRPQMRTVNRLAAGLGVSTDEFYLDPAQLLYRRFDRQTNPVVQEVVESHPQLFTNWTAADFDELHSRVGQGGPLTVEGTLSAVRDMNLRRGLYEKLAVLLESSHAPLVHAILEVMYNQVVVHPTANAKE